MSGDRVAIENVHRAFTREPVGYSANLNHMTPCESPKLDPVGLQCTRANLTLFNNIIAGDFCNCGPCVWITLKYSIRNTEYQYQELLSGPNSLLLNTRHYGTNLLNSCTFYHHHPSHFKTLSREHYAIAHISISSILIWGPSIKIWIRVLQTQRWHWFVHRGKGNKFHYSYHHMEAGLPYTCKITPVRIWEFRPASMKAYREYAGVRNAIRVGHEMRYYWSPRRNY